MAQGALPVVAAGGGLGRAAGGAIGGGWGKRRLGEAPAGASPHRSQGLM